MLASWRWCAVVCWAIICCGALPAASAVGAEGRADARVVGGSNASDGAVPFQVALWDPSAGSQFDGQFCGGAVLDATHVVTAAHCVTTSDGVSQPFRVLAGTSKLRLPGQAPAPGEVDAAVAAVTVDPGYVPEAYDRDVALITLARPLFSGTPGPGDRIAPINVADSSNELADPQRRTTVTVSGWGDTNPEPSGAANTRSPNFPVQLQTGSQRLVPDAECAEQYRSLVTLTPNMICGSGSASACQGDSGGPLTGETGTARVLIGLVSFGAGCAQPGFSDVYARTAEPTTRAFITSQLSSSASTATPSGDPSPPAATVGAAPPSAPPAMTTPAPVAPAPPSSPSPSPSRSSVDRIRPQTRVVRSRCTTTSCRYNIKATDPPPTSGIARLDARQRWMTPARCSRTTQKGRRATARARNLQPQALLAGSYLLRVPRVLGARSTVTLYARDKAGNRQMRGSVLRVPALKKQRRHCSATRGG